jgi:hypothetical protein
MDFDRFQASLTSDRPPKDASVLLQALWYDARGSWDQAHLLVQSQQGAQAAAIHAYLHRKEGDLANANYWYARAGIRCPGSGLQAEWRALVDGLLGERASDRLP